VAFGIGNLHNGPRIIADSEDSHGFDPQKSVESRIIRGLLDD